MLRSGLLLVAAASLGSTAGCATRFPVTAVTAITDRGTAVATDVTGAMIARTALDMLGTPYRYGGNDPTGFDCSGLVQFAHARHGIALPRTTLLQYRHEKRDPPELRPGDVLFFRIKGRVAHSGIYLGDGRFVHAPSSGSNVSVSRTDNPYFSDRLAGVRRFHE